MTEKCLQKAEEVLNLTLITQMETKIQQQLSNCSVPRKEAQGRTKLVNFYQIFCFSSLSKVLGRCEYQ